MSQIALLDCVFPEDTMLCILTRLPVKSIVRFKAVCQPWCELFSTPKFIKMHHHQSSSYPDNQSLIIYSSTNKYSSTISLFNVESNENKPTAIDHPFFLSDLMGRYNFYPQSDIVGCSNGLVCINRYAHGIIVWNPAMGLFKSAELTWGGDYGKSAWVTLGFGYDSAADEYKVVRLVCWKNNKIWVELYSFYSDSWKTIELDFQYKCTGLPDRCNAIVNGNLYWIAKVDGSEFEDLLCFDVMKTEFKIVSLSIFNRGEEAKAEREFLDWNGSLGAVLCFKDDNNKVQSVSVWVFDEGEQGWRKSRTFRPNKLEVYRILDCSGNGKTVCCCPDGSKLFVYYLKSGCVKKLRFYGARPGSFEVFRYTESLAFIKGMEEVEVRKKRSKTKRKRN